MRPGAVAVSLVLLLGAAAGAEDFEVLVLRGSTIVRVSGDENGPHSEVTLREDPTPAALEPREEPDPVPELVIRIEAAQPEPEVVHGWAPAWGRPVLRRPPARPQPARFPQLPTRRSSGCVVEGALIRVHR